MHMPWPGDFVLVLALPRVVNPQVLPRVQQTGLEVYSFQMYRNHQGSRMQATLAMQIVYSVFAESLTDGLFFPL